MLSRPNHSRLALRSRRRAPARACRDPRIRPAGLGHLGLGRVRVQRTILRCDTRGARGSCRLRGPQRRGHHPPWRCHSIEVGAPRWRWCGRPDERRVDALILRFGFGCPATQRAGTRHESQCSVGLGIHGRPDGLGIRGRLDGLGIRGRSDHQDRQSTRQADSPQGVHEDQLHLWSVSPSCEGPFQLAPPQYAHNPSLFHSASPNSRSLRPESESIDLFSREHDCSDSPFGGVEETLAIAQVVSDNDLELPQESGHGGWSLPCWDPAHWPAQGFRISRFRSQGAFGK
jgi:hypothetical protein